MGKGVEEQNMRKQGEMANRGEVEIQQMEQIYVLHVQYVHAHINYI